MESASTSAALTMKGALSLAQPAKIAALQTLWATLPASDLTGDKLAAVNALRVPGPAVDVQRTAIKALLTGTGALAKLQAYAASPPQPVKVPTVIAVNYLLAIVGYEMTYSYTLQTSNPVYAAAIQNLVPGLTADPATGVTAGVVAQLMALIQPLVPWWEMNGFTAPVTVWDLISAGNFY
jgi:hypothetical protein